MRQLPRIGMMLPPDARMIVDAGHHLWISVALTGEG